MHVQFGISHSYESNRLNYAEADLHIYIHIFRAMLYRLCGAHSGLPSNARL